MDSIAVMTANAMRLAATQYNDATAFVAILQENELADYRINGPVVVNTMVPGLKGQRTLLLPPTLGIRLGDFVYCNGIQTCSVVIGVTQKYSLPAIPFCSCSVKTSTVSILPPQGVILSTEVTISPGLDDDLVVGSVVTFTVGAETTIEFPSLVPLSVNGVPT